MQRFGVENHHIKKHTFIKILKIQITHEKENDFIYCNCTAGRIGRV